MAERTAILIDRYGNHVGVAGNPLYVGGFTTVGSFVDLTDVAVASPASGDYIGYDAATGKYVNKPVSGTGMGDVTGPSGATAGNFASLDSSGKIISDSGKNATSFGDVNGPATSTARSIAGFSDTGGKTLISLPPTVSALGVLDMKGQKIIGVAPPDSSGDVATKLYVDQFIQGVAWQMPVIAILAASPASPADEARYIVADVAAGDWIGHEDSIATWWAAGNDWVYAAPGDGWACYNQDTGTIWVYNMSLGHWIDIGTSGIPEAPSTGTPWSRQDSSWVSAQENLFGVNVDDQIYPLPTPGMMEHIQIASYESGTHPYSHTWPDVDVYVSPGAVVTLRGLGDTFTVDDNIELVTPLGTFDYFIGLEAHLPIDVTAHFNIGHNTAHIRTYSTISPNYYTPDLYFYVTPGGTRDVVPRNAGTGFIGSLTKYWRGIFADTITAISGFKVGADALSYLHVGAAAANHVHPLATQVASGFLLPLNGNVASYLSGNGTWVAGGAPAAHASSHISTGGDPILPASPSGYSGLMTGVDKTRVDVLSAPLTVATVFDDTANLSDSIGLFDAGNTTSTCRVLISGAVITTSGDYIQIKIAGISNVATIANMGIAPQASGKNSTVVPTPVTFGGSTGVTLGSAGAVSDWIKYAIDETLSYLVVFDFTGSPIAVKCAPSGIANRATYYCPASNVSCNIATPTGTWYTISQSTLVEIVKVALLVSPAFSGVPTAPTAAANTNTTQLATTAYVIGQAATATPLVESGAGAVGTATKLAREDHVHPAATAGSGGQYLVQRAIEGVVYETTTMYWVAPASCTVASATMSLVAVGSYCKVQVMKNGILETNSIFASDVAMQVASTDTPVNGVYQSNGTLDAAQVTLAKGDRVEFRVNQADTGCADLLIQLRCTIT